MLRHATVFKSIFLFVVLGGVVAPAFGEPVRKKGRRASQKRTPDKLNQGDVALDFKLKTVDGKRQVRLSSFRGDRPVALIFGSYT